MQTPQASKRKPLRRPSADTSGARFCKHLPGGGFTSGARVQTPQASGSRRPGLPHANPEALGYKPPGRAGKNPRGARPMPADERELLPERAGKVRDIDGVCTGHLVICTQTPRSADASRRPNDDGCGTSAWLTPACAPASTRLDASPRLYGARRPVRAGRAVRPTCAAPRRPAAQDSKG